MKAKICELCHSETRSGYHIDIFYITGVTTPIPACDTCKELLNEAKETIDKGRPVQNTEQKIRLSYLLTVAKKYLDKTILQRSEQ